MPWLTLIQVTLVTLWYAVPAMATVPAVVIFLPFLIPAFVLGMLLLFMLAMIILAAVVS